jgi:integrase
MKDVLDALRQHHADQLKRQGELHTKGIDWKPIRIHDLRHTFATLAIGAGIPIKVVSESLGHADIATTLRTYAHVLPVQRAELAEKIGALLFRGSSEAM